MCVRSQLYIPDSTHVDHVLVSLTAADRVSNVLHSISFCKLDVCMSFLNLHLIISVQDGLSPLYVACQYGHKLTVDVLLKNGANVNLAATVSMSLYRVFKTCMPVTLLDVHCSKYHGMVV